MLRALYRFLYGFLAVGESGVERMITDMSKNKVTCPYCGCTDNPSKVHFCIACNGYL